jgi:hypothetical protein
MTKEQRINVRVNESDAKELREISKQLDLPSSCIVRQAVREKIAELKRTHPHLQPQQQTV